MGAELYRAPRLPADSTGYPWNGRYIVASGNLLADFRANAAAEAQGRLQTARLYNMTDDPGVKDMLKFNLARDTLHQNLWLKAIEELQADGLETTVAPNALFDEEYAEHATSVWHLSDGTAGAQGGWASGPQPDGRHEFGYLMDPEPLGDAASPPPPDPALYATYDGSDGKLMLRKALMRAVASWTSSGARWASTPPQSSSFPGMAATLRAADGIPRSAASRAAPHVPE
jgi:Mn-containing catalase